MTTKPKARKFRIRRSSAAPARPAADARGAAPRQDARLYVAEDRQPAAAAPTARGPDKTSVPPAQGRTEPAAAPSAQAGDAVGDVSGRSPEAIRHGLAGGAATARALREGQVDSAQQVAGEIDIDAIRREGLTGRQLRMARRVAQKHGLAPTSDFDAVRQLRSKGIDPFQRSNMLQLVVPSNEDGEDGAKGTSLQTRPQDLPQTVPAKGAQLPSTEMAPADRRANEIMNIQRDIARRRRRKLALLMTRLSFFVFLPTILAGWYFFAIATPMYSAKSEFLILQADSAGGSGLGGLFSGTQFATNQDAIAVQSYLQSKDAMLRLDADVGFREHFSQEWIDPVQRLPEDPSNEDAYKIFKKFVNIGYDPTEGVIKMEVVAADPDTSAEFSRRLISYAEERVDELSRRKREDSMRSAQEALSAARLERREAQQRLVSLQETEGVDPTAQLGALRTQITSVEIQLQEKELELQALLDNARPNKAKVDGVRGDVRRLTELRDSLNMRMTDAATGQNSLAAKAARIQMAQADLATADLFLQSAITNEKQTVNEANRQVRYLTTAVPPVASQDPSYPRSFENTILAFLIFSGIYLMISLTASILREQVSS